MAPVTTILQQLAALQAQQLPHLATISSRLSTISSTLTALNAAQQRNTNAVEQQSGQTRGVVQQLAKSLTTAISGISPPITSGLTAINNRLQLRDGWEATGSAYWLAAIARHFRIA